MSDTIEVLTLGPSPNLSFYAWRLQETRTCNVTVVNEQLDLNHPIDFDSNIFGYSQFQPSTVVHSLDQVAAYRGNDIKFDIIIISCTSLQDFQTISNQIYPYLYPNSLILIESTGYINLEPFLKLNFNEMWSDLAIASIMNESDVRYVPPSSRAVNQYVHRLRNTDNRIYIGSAVPQDFNLNQHPSFQKAFKLFQLVTEDSNNKIALLKSVLPKEFMTYQWKLALSRIILSPLMVLFEIAYPEELNSQILCKPLISGLLNELLKIIKKMDCKLVKGYENEANLLNYWSASFPAQKDEKSAPAKYLNTPALFYGYYHQFNLEIDLLLLQPILLGDDNGVRTPYLENLYSIMCQLIKINDPTQNSIFFQRKSFSKKDSIPDSHISDKSMQLQELSQNYDQKLNHMNVLTNDLNELEGRFNKLSNSIKEKEMLHTQLSNDLESKQSLLATLSSNLDKQQRKFDVEQTTYNNLVRDIENLNLQKKNQAAQPQHASSNSADRSMDGSQQADNSFNGSANNQPQVQNNPQLTQPPNNRDMSFSNKNARSAMRDSVMTTDNLADLTDIAVYGAQLDGGEISASSTPRQISSSRSQPQSLNQAYEPQSNGADQNGKAEKMQGAQFQGQQVSGFPQSNGSSHQQETQQQGYMQSQSSGPMQGPVTYQGTGPQYNKPMQSPQGYNPQMNMNQMQMNGQVNPQMNGQMNPQMNGQMNPQMNGQMNPQMTGPMNGMGMNGMNMNMNNMNSMNMNGQMNRYSTAPKGRLNSLQSNTYYDNMSMNPMQMQMMNGQMNPMQMQMMNGQMNPMQMQMMNNPMNQMNGGNGGGMPNPVSMQSIPYQQRPRAQNRRSGFNTMQDNLSGIDMGGRGGMPMPGAKPQRKSTAGIPLSSTANGRAIGADDMTTSRHNKSMSTGNVMESHLKIDQNHQHLKPPTMNENSSGSSKSSDAPVTVGSNDITINVPEAPSKPLGGVVGSNKVDDKAKKKKKKGLFR